MSQKTFSLAAGIIFMLVALAHLLRIVFAWEAVLNGRIVPMWWSWLTVLVAGFLGFRGIRLAWNR